VELHSANVVAENIDFLPKPESSKDFQNLFDNSDTHNLALTPGLLVELKGNLGIGMVHIVLSEMVGVELEGPMGNSDGMHEGQRYFTCPKDCAAFVNQNDEIVRILPVGHPPRFNSQVHDIFPGDVVMVSQDIGVGIARYVSAQIVGIELNAPCGDSSGEYLGKRFFRVQDKHALFKTPQTLKKIHPENLLNKLNLTVEKLSNIEQDLRRSVNPN